MKDAFILKTLFPSYDEKHSQEYNEIGDAIILSVFTIFFYIVGLVGNGNVIWLLGFRIKRKPFALYFLNLAVADFGSLLFLFPFIAYNHPLFDIPPLPPVVEDLLVSFFLLMYSSCQLFLAAISIDRCVSVLFPKYYQSHQSVVSSTAKCTSIWATSLVLGGVPLIQWLSLLTSGSAAFIIIFQYVVSTLICVFIVIISTLTLIITACLKSQQGQQRNLLKVVLLMLLSFLLFILLGNVCIFMEPLQLLYFALWNCLKSSINPLIYFLAGRQKGGKFQERMKFIFQRVFKEERDTRMERQPHAQTML